MRAMAALLLLAVATPASADPPAEMVQIGGGEPVTIRADRAYILFRRVRPEGVTGIEPIFMRVPTAAEMERYREARRAAFARAQPELLRRYQRRLQRDPQRAGTPPSEATFPFEFDEIANTHNIEDDPALEGGRPESVHLVEVLPGDYVLYGANFGSGFLVDALYACMCLGTVGFSVRPGEVTDLGYFMADLASDQTPIPELQSEAGLGRGATGLATPIVATMRPPNARTQAPRQLSGARVVAVEYRAVGKFFDPRAGSINRLVPVPGVLDYEGGRVIHVRTGQEAQGGHY